MKLLVDIDIVLDVLLARQPWLREAALLLQEIEKGHAQGFVAGHTITTAFYVVAKAGGKQAAAAGVTGLLRFLDVVPVEKADFQQALLLRMGDFEDAVQAVCALKVGADLIVTRDVKDFQGLPIRPEPPGVVLAMLPKR